MGDEAELNIERLTQDKLKKKNKQTKQTNKENLPK